MQQINTLNDLQNYISGDINKKDENEKGVIQAIFEEYTFNKEVFLVYCLQNGYQITREDRKTMRDKCDHIYYKKYATLSRLAYILYKKGRPDLIEELFYPYGTFTGAIYTIESLIQDQPKYFDYKTNVWLCIANNAITHYKEYWIFIEAALKQYGKWEDMYKINSFKTKYDLIDKNAILQWKDQKQYEILTLLYPQLKVPTIQIKIEVTPIDGQDHALFQESKLTRTLNTLSVNIEKQTPVWVGFNNIAGRTAEEKVHSLWNTIPHNTFLEALLYLSDSKSSYIILNQLKDYAVKEVMDCIYNTNIYFTLQTGLETGRIRHFDFLFLLWKLGYRYHTLQEWKKIGNLTNEEQVKLHCMDTLYGNVTGIDLREIVNSHIMRIISMIEGIKNNDFFITNMPNWKAYINTIRGSSRNHPLYAYWGYIDMALDGYHCAGQSMRNYLLRTQPGIRLEKSQENIIVDSDLYKALSILYPEIYKGY